MLFIALLLVAPIFCRAQESNVYDSLHSYLEAISTMPVDSINARLDALLDSVDDNDVRARMAGIAFDYYMHCPVMGAEGVSVYLADNYFLNRRLKWPNDETYPSLYAFAEFNRQSLLGMPAPELALESLEGGVVDIRDARGALKILYFYEDGCSTCSRQTPLITALLKEYTGETPLTLYAVYTQGDREAWARYAFANFYGIDNPRVTVFNLWDPEGASEFHKKYSVLTTPSLLLLDADNRIAGRRLDADALSSLLGQKESFTSSLYALLDGVRDNLGLDKESVSDLCEAFSSRISDDPGLYRDTYLGIYNYLRNQQDYAAQQSAAFVLDKYIVSRPELWSKEMLAAAEDALRRFSMNPVGAVATDLQLLDRHGRSRSMLSQGGKRYTVLFFNLVSCSDCAAWKKQLHDMKKLLRRGQARVVSVYVGPDPAEWKASLKGCSCHWRNLRAEWPVSDLYEKYDVTTVPKLYLLDSDGTIIAKDITPDTLIRLLED